MKKLIFLLMMVIFLTTRASYADKVENAEDTTLIEQSLEKYVNQSESLVLDNNGKDVTSKHDLNLKNFYMNKQFDKAKEYVLNNDIIFGWNEGISTRAALAKNTSKTFYALKKSTNYQSIQKEWMVRLSGTFYYEQNRKYITSVKSPYLKIETARFGSGFTPYLTNVSIRGVKVDTYTAGFSATYTMQARMSIQGIEGTVLFPAISISYNASV